MGRRGPGLRLAEGVDVLESLGRWSRPGFLVAGVAMLTGGVALAAILLYEPVAVIWLLPSLGPVVGVVAGAGAFIALHHDLARHTRGLAVTSTTLAATTLVAALLATATVVVAVGREELPGGLAVVALPMAILGFAATSLLASIAALVTDALPWQVAAALGAATALTLALVGFVVVTGELSPLLLVVVLAGWGLALVALSRLLPRPSPHR